MMKRRHFIRNTSLAATASAMFPILNGCAGREKNEANLVLPNKAQLHWQDLELGLAYHYDLDVFMPGGHHHERSRLELLDKDLYNPTQLDMDQWLEASKILGARYAFFTATHHQGFLQWQSDLYPFGLKNIAWREGKADLVEEFVNSCAKFGIIPGIYIGIRFNAYWGIYQFETNFGKGGNPEKKKQYLEVCEKITEELVSRYGKFVEIWYDGGVPTPGQGGPDVLPIVQKYQPDAIFYHSDQLREHRWAGNEDGVAPYPCWSTVPDMASVGYHGGDPEGNVWMPAFSDTPIRDHEWVWVPDREEDLISLDRLVHMYYNSVGKNTNLIIGAIPDRRGLIPEVDMKRYGELGDEIRKRFDNKIAEISGEGEDLELKINKDNHLNQLVIMEDLSRGERILEYTVEAFMKGEWNEIATGESVGHKRIHMFPSISAERIRLRCTLSKATPVIRSMAVYYC